VVQDFIGVIRAGGAGRAPPPVTPCSAAPRRHATCPHGLSRGLVRDGSADVDSSPAEARSHASRCRPGDPRARRRGPRDRAGGKGRPP